MAQSIPLEVAWLEERSFYNSQEEKKEESDLPVADDNQEVLPASSEVLGSILETTCSKEHGQHISPDFSVHLCAKNSPQDENEAMMSLDGHL